MKIFSRFLTKGLIKILFKDNKENLIKEILFENQIMQKGLELLTNTVVNQDLFLNKIAIGNGILPTNNNQLNLSNEIIRKDIQNKTIVNLNFQKDCIEYITTFYSTDFSGKFTEVGLFKDNILFSRVTFQELEKTPYQSITIIWQIAFLLED